MRRIEAAKHIARFRLVVINYRVWYHPRGCCDSQGAYRNVADFTVFIDVGYMTGSPPRWGLILIFILEAVHLTSCTSGLYAYRLSIRIKRT